MNMNRQDGIVIEVPKEFNFQQNMNYMSRSSNECMFEIRDNTIIKAISVSDKDYLIEVSEAADGNLLLRFLGDAQIENENAYDDVIRYVRDWFDLDRDLKPFYDMAQKDPLLQTAVVEFYGLRNIGIPDLFEAVAWGIIGQQINLTYAYTLKKRFVETYGRSMEWDGHRYWIFPEAKDIAKLTVEELSSIKTTTKKCEYLIKVAELLEKGELSKPLIKSSGSIKEAEKRLTSIRGIGPWTANYVLMRCLRFPDAFPIDDVGLHNAIKHLTGSERKPTKEEILKLAAPWENWEAYATFYLWRYLY